VRLPFFGSSRSKSDGADVGLRFTAARKSSPGSSKKPDICPHVTHETKEVDGVSIAENTCGTTSTGVQYVCPMTEEGKQQYCNKLWKCTTERKDSKYVFYGSWVAERCGKVNCPLKSEDGENCGKIGNKYYACPR